MGLRSGLDAVERRQYKHRSRRMRKKRMMKEKSEKGRKMKEEMRELYRY
jgi:hypothetical protein